MHALRAPATRCAPTQPFTSPRPPRTPAATRRSLDVSEWMRNGDYVPTRADAQYDAAAMICGVKVDQNPESTVGVLTAGGKGCVARGSRACVRVAITSACMSRTRARGSRVRAGARA